MRARRGAFVVPGVRRYLSLAHRDAGIEDALTPFAEATWGAA